MRRVPAQKAELRFAHQRVLTPASPEFGISGVAGLIMNPASNITWVAANDPVGYKFRLSYPAVVDQLGICHGSSAGGNFDVGVYDESFVRLVSTGSTGGTGNNQWQWVDVTNTSLLAGRVYWLFASRDNTTASRQRSFGDSASVNLNSACGMGGSTTDAFPLPDPITNIGVPGTSVLYIMGIALRAPF